MKDLKYLYEFENLLQEANNALVQQEKAAGGIALDIPAITYRKYCSIAGTAFLSGSGRPVPALWISPLII